MGGKKLKKSKSFIASLLMCSIFISTFSVGLFLVPEKSEVLAAQSTIDPDASAAGTSHIMSGSQTVFIDDQTGYKFFVDAPGNCVYRKTTDGGSSWSGTTTVDSQIDCLAISVWYDKWTPGSASSSIHIATIDANPDDAWYNRLDTNGDTLLLGSSPVSVATAQGGTLAAGTNQVSITRGTDGTIYISSIDASDSYVMECTFSCNNAGSWTETGTDPFGLTNNYAILAPLPNGNILAIHRDVVLEDIGSKVWNNAGGTWDVATTTFDTNATDNVTYDVGMAMTVSTTTGDIYLAYIAGNTTPGTDDQIRTARYSGGTWSSTKEVVRYSEKGLTNVAIALDTSNDDVYVAYSARTTPGTVAAGNIYWRKSADNMSSWSYENGPLNASADDMYGVDLNISSNERIYASWFDNTDDDIFGDTLADIFPGVHVTSEAFPEINSSDSYSQVTIDPTGHANGTSNIMSGSQTVFLDDQTGYKFFRDAPGFCVYRKTSDGGASWSATTTVDSQTDCHQIQVWYDKWTPGSASSSIHIVTADSTADDLWYNRLDTAGDTLLLGSTPVSMTGTQGGSLTEAENYVSITRGTDGTLYAVSNDGTTGPDSFIVECTVSCSVAGNWSETGVNPLDAASDFNILMPLSGGNIMLINRDISNDVIRYKTWNNTAWSASWISIGVGTENATYDVGMAVAVSSSTGNLYLAFIANNATVGTDDEIRTHYYSGGSWATTTVVSTSTVLGLTNVAIALDYSNDDVYVGYSAQAAAGTAASANVLWKKSVNDMASWGYEQGPVNTSPDDLYGVDLNMSGNGRLYVTWFDNTDDDIYGATMMDLPSPSTADSPVQITSVYASTTNVYSGGRFVLYNTNELASRDVTGVTITESGSIDALTSISNVKLLYETDTASPYDCASVSYNGNEALFGSVDVNGFSGADGVSSFTGTTVTLNNTTALCVYPVFDVLDSALSSSTIEISIANAQSDVTVTSDVAGPTASQNIYGSTLVYNDIPTLTHFHWRNDNGSEVTATSKTSGIEDTTLSSLQKSTTTRLRLQVSNEGSSSTPAIQYRLEYGVTSDLCIDATGWTDVGAAGGAFDMSNSVNLTDAADTSNIGTSTGGVTDENITFLTPNGGVKDTSSQTGNILLTTSQYVELEYSILASTTAVEGTSYCFRVTDRGVPIHTYTNYAKAIISSDVTVSAATTSSQVATTSIPATNFYIGGTFVIAENSNSRNVTSITISENSTIDAQNDLDNIRLKYDLDTTLPYNCVSESYGGSELQFGATNTIGFSSDNGTSTFTGSVTISTTTAMCVYVVLDTTDTTQNDENMNIVMETPPTNLVVSGGGSISPSATVDLTGSTTFKGAVLTQTHYHWRSDLGIETASTSLTNGIQDTAISNIAQNTPVRLRMQVSNEGSTSSRPRALRIEYAPKITTCSAATSWVDVGASGGAWDMYNSAFLADGTNTTDIPIGAGGLTNENTTFKTPNNAIKDASSTIATTTLSATEYIEAEFSMRQTTDAGYDTTYCFRLSTAEVVLNAYTTYAELTTAPERDFEIQRGTFVMTSPTTTITAGVHYVAPSASTSAFIRITNSHYTGAGNNFGGAAQNADDITVYISNPSNIMTSVTFLRPAAASGTTRVAWEIIEFIGEASSDNEMIVRAQSNITYAAAGLSATTSAVSGISDDANVVVFITGQVDPDTLATNFNSGQSTSQWNSSGDTASFWRGVSGSDASIVSYAVVEFTGLNWVVQRSEHTYSSAGTTETEPITAVNDLTRAFLHTQKRIITGLTGIDEFGHEVWLSSIGEISYFLESGATTPSGQTSVAWVIENLQSNSGAMEVTHAGSSLASGGAPATSSISIGKTLTDITNASIFINTRSAGTGTNYPRPIVYAIIASTTHYDLWRSNGASIVTYRTEIVEWPTAGLAIRQNYYRLYVDNNALDPTDPWPVGGTSDLGENTALTNADEPLGEGEHIRIRMTLHAVNATFPEATRAFKLQFGRMVTTCSAITESNWFTLGNSASSTVWRGYNATGTTDGTNLSGDPPTLGDLNISVSDVAGTLEEINDSTANPYAIGENEDGEYDWIVEQNGANADVYYCFRMIETNGTTLAAYDNYPQIRTASFTPRSQNWRWYDDETSITPTVALAAENVTPIDITGTQTVKLRVSVAEIKNIARDDVRFKLQYSEYSNFLAAHDVVATSTCTATSTWCYTNGGGVDNAVVPSILLSDSNSCVAGVGDGCGTHNESPQNHTGFRHENHAVAEYDFSLVAAAPRVNRVYYFRLYDIAQDIPVPKNDNETYPSLTTQGASLSFIVRGTASSTVVEGITTDRQTGTTTVSFGSLSPNTPYEAAQQLQITTNATEGYQIFLVTDSALINSSGDIISPTAGTNASPNAWNTGCTGLNGCSGYHAGDDTLYGGSTRFSPADSYAAFTTTTPEEIAYSSVPVSADTVDLIIKLQIGALQEAGTYGMRMRYIAVPIF